jgi:hypothetical protein
MIGSIDSTNEATERLFVARLRPSEAHGEWSLRVRPLERWNEAQRAGWLGLIAECIHPFGGCGRVMWRTRQPDGYGVRRRSRRMGPW